MYVMPVEVFQFRDWSTKSQIQPPCRIGLARMMSQYSLRLPPELPMQWVYSIITYGRRSFVSRARFATPAGLSYMAERMSLTSGRLSPSYWMIRVGSAARIQSRIVTKLLPRPASLPSDQMITDGWFLSRWTIWAARSRTFEVQSDLEAGYWSRIPCVSRLTSSTTYRPYSSASS